MWKIVKAELSYWKPVIVISCGAFIAAAIIGALGTHWPHQTLLRWSEWPLEDLAQYSRAQRQLCAQIRTLAVGIFAVHILVNFIVLFVEVKEARLRSLVPLPFSLIEAAIARTATPVLLLGAYMLLGAVCLLILLAEPLVMYRGEALYFVRGIYYDLVTDVPLLNGLGWWWIITFGTRLLSEWQGRMLLLVLLVLLLIEGTIVPLIDVQFSWKVSAYLFHHFANPKGSFVPMVVAFVFCCLVPVFLGRRKSHLE